MPNFAIADVQNRISGSIQGILNSLPAVESVPESAARHAIARYGAVLEGNFIGWMCAANICCKSTVAHAITHENLREEIKDNHPGMLRRFVTAAQAIPTESDFIAVQDGIEKVRNYIGRMNSVDTLILMASFESFISVFMPYLAGLAKQLRSTDYQYTDVHGVVDIGHSEQLYNAIVNEIKEVGLSGSEPSMEGVDLILNLMKEALLPISQVH